MPSSARSQLKELADLLVAHESIAGQASQAMEPSAFRVCDKLRRPLAMLAGLVGFRSLLARAVTLAKAKAPDLVSVQVTTTGSLEFSAASQTQPNPNGSVQAGTIIVAEFLGLLEIFIGEALTLRLLREIWPEVIDDYDLKKEKKL